MAGDLEAAPEGFEWDTAKSAANLRSHGVSFEEAVTVFSDEYGAQDADELHSDAEDRFITVGHSERGRLLAVVWTWRGETRRVITARGATRREAQEYVWDD